MAKQNIEYDLLRTLKKIRKDELYYTILKIINGKYRFENEYLNSVSHEVILIYLEKFLVISNGFVPKDEKETFEALVYFMENIDQLKFRHLRADIIINLKYNLRVNLATFKGKALTKKTIMKITSLLLFATLAMSMTGMALNANDVEIEYEDFTTVEFDSEFKQKDSILATNNPDNNFVLENTTYKEEINTEPVELSLDDKINIILEDYNLTLEEFDVLCAIAMTEAKTNSYEDTYAVINTIYNRISSKTWVVYISSLWGIDVGGSLYYQAITSGQFVVYENGRYVMNLGIREGDSFQAVIDFLLTKEIKHNYLSFKTSDTDLDEYELFVIGGNKYHNPMLEEDRIVEEEITRA